MNHGLWIILSCDEQKRNIFNISFCFFQNIKESYYLLNSFNFKHILVVFVINIKMTIKKIF